MKNYNVKNVLQVFLVKHVLFMIFMSVSSLHAMDQDEIDTISYLRHNQLSEAAVPSSSISIRTVPLRDAKESVSSQLPNIGQPSHQTFFVNNSLISEPEKVSEDKNIKGLIKLFVVNCSLTLLDILTKNTYNICIENEQSNIITTGFVTLKTWSTLREDVLARYLKQCLDPSCPITNQVTFPLRIFSQVTFGKSIKEYLGSKFKPLLSFGLGIAVNYIEDTGGFSLGIGNSLIYASLIPIVDQCKKIIMDSYERNKSMNLKTLKEILKKIR